MIEIVTDLQILPRKYLIGNESKALIRIVSGKKEEFDETDIKIIKLIGNDARLSLVHISNALNLDNMTIKRRIERMEKNGTIAGFLTIISPKVMGIKNFSVNLKLFDFTQIKQLEEFVRQMPEVTSIQKSLGGYDFTFEIEVKDLFDIESIIRRIKENYPVLKETVHFTSLRYTIHDLFARIDDILK